MTTIRGANRNTARWLTILAALAAFDVLSMAPCVVFAQGKLESGQLTSSALAGNLLGDSATRVYWVYLPPSYETSQARYPVFYVLHGYTQNSSSLTSIKPVIDRMIQDGEIREMIAVFVDGSNILGGSHSRSSVTIGDYETYITKDLVNLIDANYRTLPQVASRAITGFSDGGDDALYLAMVHPDVFSVVVGQGIAGNLNAFESVALATADVNPQSLSDFSNLDLMVQWILSFAAVVAPNPGKPPLFLDKPAEMLDGQAQLVPGVWERLLEQDNIHLIGRYLSNLTRLRGIKFVNGVKDSFNPIRDVRALSERMRELGIAHTFIEHSGGHAFLPEESLGFMSRVFSGALPQVQSVTADLTIVAGQPVPEVTVVLAAPPEATGRYPELSLDLSSLGVSEPLPMHHDGSGRYTARPSLAPLGTGLHYLSVSMEEGTDTPFPLSQVRLTVWPVWPAGDLQVIADEVAEGWKTQVQMKVTLDPKATGQVFQGRSALAAQTNGLWVIALSPAQPVSPLGYTALRFAFHPGDASGDALDVAIGSKRTNLWPGKPDRPRVDLAAKSWQVVEIPLDGLDPFNPFTSITFSGKLNGTFYLDDLRLVASPPPPPPPTAVLEDHAATRPQRFALEQNYPNPFNSETVIRFALPRGGEVELALYNLTGQKVVALMEGSREAGEYTVRWDGRDEQGHELASGVYLVRLESTQGAAVRKVTLLR